MKNLIIVIFIIFLTSCVKRKCYTCKLYKEDKNNGIVTLDTNTIQKCNMTEEEISQYEKDNYYYKEKTLYNSYYKKTMKCN